MWLTRRAVLAGGAAGLAGCSGGSVGGTDPETTVPSDGLALASPAFDDGEPIPAKYSCEGENVNPELSVTGVPPEAESLALVVDDPDAPREEPYVHWLLWNAPPGTTTVPEGVEHGERPAAIDGARQGAASDGTVGYVGMCPPTSHDAHTYRFTLSALDVELDLAGGASREELDAAMAGHVLAQARLTGSYDRD